MLLNKISPIYVFIAGFTFLLTGALFKIMQIPFSTVFLFWGFVLKIYAMIRFCVIWNHSFTRSKEIS